MTFNQSIRPAAAADLGALWAINDAATPGVGAVTETELARLVALPEATTFVAADADDAPLGFLLLMAPGADYHSPNYRWFEDRLARGDGKAFVYVDRIAVAAAARGRRIGEALYESAFAAAPAGAVVIACEVNTLPPNPGSMRFHGRLGFEQVGAAVHAPGEKEVAYLERALPGAALRPAR